MEKEDSIRELAGQFYDNLAQPDPEYLAQLRKLSPQDVMRLEGIGRASRAITIRIKRAGSGDWQTVGMGGPGARSGRGEYGETEAEDQEAFV